MEMRLLQKWVWILLVVGAIFSFSSCRLDGSASVWQCWCTWSCEEGRAPDFSMSQASCAYTSSGAANDAERRCENSFPVVRSCREGRCDCSRCKNNLDVACTNEFERDPAP